ncbi:uncharacterized protein LOC111593783 [Drosophila hydei]|uniref:Uncharacterized protein LOC111593783 n=1 Tax=Drosophila hydei TaxID=7224 RepID=A0A6J1L9F9_DROHY|nr:uncharacterized protein LOC111593783 [Drosophila hydei]
MFHRPTFSYRKLLLALILITTIYIYVEHETKAVAIERRPTDTRNLSINVSSQSRATAPTIAFNVFDHQCKIPRIDPFSADVLAIFKPPKLKKCTDQPDLFTVRYYKQHNQYMLRFNKPLFLELFPTVRDYACVLYEIISGPREPPSWNKGLPVACRDWIVPRHISGIVVECHEIGNRSRILQRDAFPLVQYPVGRNEKNDEERSRINPSVIMLGIDSMSQMNFQRTMPLTAQFVRQLGWYEMLGYTSAGDYTLYNLMIFLTGRPPQRLQPFCDMAKPGCLDAITYLWNHFHNSGYLTAFAEDSPTLNFTRKPVDYYLYPILEAFRQIMEGVKRVKDDYCLGRKQSFRYVLESCLQVVQRFMHETQKPLFGLFWTKSFSHEDFSAAARVDEDFVKYLELYREHGLFKKAVVILFSLHGQRKGPLMKLASGFLEERLPMLHIYLPPWYRKQYPEIAHALDVNRRRLCSTTDLHLTIKDLLVHVHPGIVFQKEQIRAQTLFERLPDNRSCVDAGISLYDCSCDLHVTIANSPQMIELAKLVVYRMANYLSTSSVLSKCYQLKYERLLRAQLQTYFDADGNQLGSNNEFLSYRLMFSTRPKGVFYATVLCSQRANIVNVRESWIRRLNFAPNESQCVDMPQARELCICRPQT